MEEKREKRIVSFLEKEKESVRMEIPLLSYTFRSAGFINLEAIQGKDKEKSVDKAFWSLSITWLKSRVKKQGIHDCPYSYEDKFWTIGPLLNFSLSLIFKMSNDHEQPSVST